MPPIRRPVLRLLPALLLLSLPIAAQGGVVRGVVYGPGRAPLAGVRIVPDEFGASLDTDSQGRFRFTVPPDVEKGGGLRLTFSLEGHQTYNLDLKLPAAGPVEVVLTPLYKRSFQPNLPPGLVSRLRTYRKAEIQRIHAFLASKEKKLLVVEGMAGMGAADLALIALQDAPAASRLPILWWDCEETDGVGMVVEDWARAFRDQGLQNLARRGREVRSEQEARSLDREAVAGLLARLARSPHTMVLGRFDRWLSKQGAVEEELAALLIKTVSHGQAGKVILVSEEKPVLPPELSAAWVDTLPVRGLGREHAVDFLRGYLGLRMPEHLLEPLAEKLDGHPGALQLFAGSLDDLGPEEREDRVRQFLQVGESAIEEGRLEPLLARSWSRLTPREARVLDLLGVVRQPLTAGEMQEILAGEEAPLTPDEIRKSAERLVRQRYWAERFEGRDEDRYAPVEMARPFLDERLAGDRPRKIELHRKALAWYGRTCPAAEMTPLGLPEPAIVAACDELAHQAFSLAELVSGAERSAVAFAGTDAVFATYSRHFLRDDHRLLLSQLGRAQRLLRDAAGDRAPRLLAEVLRLLGDVYFQRWRLTEAESVQEEALALFRRAGERRGEANTLRSLGDLYLRLGRRPDAERVYGQALPLFRAFGDPLGEANTLRSIGDLFYETSRLSEAETAYGQALSLYRRIGSPLGEAHSLKSLADLYADTARLAEAEQHYREALPRLRQAEDHLGEAHALRRLGDLYASQGRVQESIQAHEPARELYREVEDRLGQIRCAIALSWGYRESGRMDEALREALEALLLAARSELREIGQLQAFVAELRARLGAATFDARAAVRIEALPPEDREILRRALEPVRRP